MRLNEWLALALLIMLSPSNRGHSPVENGTQLQSYFPKPSCRSGLSPGATRHTTTADRKPCYGVSHTSLPSSACPTGFGDLPPTALPFHPALSECRAPCSSIPSGTVPPCRGTPRDPRRLIIRIAAAAAAILIMAAAAAAS